MSRTFDYAVFGLTLRSDIPLPELFPAGDMAVPDVTIELGSIPINPQGEDDGLNQLSGALVLAIPEVGRYRIEAGNRITVESEPGVPERNLRLFLLGSAFGVLLHQRGLLPLHANAIEIEIDGKAVAFMGESGAGKSTVAAWFHDRGYRVVSDDVCVIGFDESQQPYAAPGLPRLRLWAEALALMGRGTAGFARSYIGEEDEKYDVPINPELAARSHVPLAAIYLLERGPEFSIVPLHGVEAADAVFANTYRGEYLAKTSGQKQHWESAVRLVRGTPVFRAIRRWDLTALEEQCSRLLHHARELPRARERSGIGEAASQS
jgi:hypothetical protein